MSHRLCVLACATTLLVVQAWALPPRRQAAPLSSILQSLEQRDDLAYFKEIEWDETAAGKSSTRTRTAELSKSRLTP